MLHSHQNTLHITQLSHQAINQLAPSFVDLPHTEHADGQYRLRRYSVVQFQDGIVLETGKNEFMQTDHFNHFQGNIVRQFRADFKIDAAKRWYARNVQAIRRNQPPAKWSGNRDSSDSHRHRVR